MNINQHFINLATRAAENGANASQIISQRDRLFKDKVVPELVKRNANDAAIAQARTKWNKQTDQVMQSAGLLPKNGQSSTSFAKDKRSEAAYKKAEKTGSSLPIIGETVRTTADTVGNLFGQGVGGMIEGAAGFVRDIGENEKDSVAAKVAQYGKDLKKGYQDSASTYQKQLQAGEQGKSGQLAAGAVQSIPAMAMPFGVAKGAASAAKLAPALVNAAPYIGMGAGNVAEHTQNYGEVRSNATANLERDFPTWEKLQGNPLFEQRFQQLVNSGVNINAARKQAHADTLDQLSEQAADKYGTAMTAIGFIAPSGAVLGSGILKNAPTSKIGKALVGGSVASALVRREIAQSPRVGMAKLIPDISVVANKEAAKMVGKQAAEEGLQGGIGEYGAQVASANIGGQAVDYGKVGQTILEEGLIGGIMGGGMQSATGGSATSQAKEVAKQLRNQTNTLRHEEATARKELADAMQFNNPEQIQSAQENLNNIGIAANKVKATYDQYGIETPYFVQHFAAQYQPVQQEQQQGLDQQAVPPEAAPVAEAQPQAVPTQPEVPKPIQVNQGMADTTNLVIDGVTKGLITPDEANAIQTDPIHGQVFSLAQSGDEAAAHNVVMNAVSLGDITPDQAQALIESVPRYKNLGTPVKPSLSGIVNDHVKSQINTQDGGLFSNPVELDPETLDPIDPNQHSPFQDNFNEPKQFMNPTRAKDYIRVNNLTDSHEFIQRNDGMIEVRPRQNNIPDDPNLNDFGFNPASNMKPVAEDPNLTDFTDGIVDTAKLGTDGIPEVIATDNVPGAQPEKPQQQKNDFSKPKHFSNYIRTYHYVKENHLEDTHEIIKNEDGSATVQLKAQPGQSEDAKPQKNNEPDVLQEDKKPEQKQKEQLAPETKLESVVEPTPAETKPEPEAEQTSKEETKSEKTIKPKTEQKTDESGISKNNAPVGMKAGDIGRKSDNQPFANESAAKGMLKKQGLEQSHEVVKLTPSKFVLRKRVKSEGDSLKSGSEEVALAQNPHHKFQNNDTPDTIKKNDIGRESDNKPFANKSAAITAIKKKGLLDTHEVVQLAPSRFVLREKLDSKKEHYESSISDMNHAKQSTHKTAAPVARDHLLKDSLDDVQHSKSEIIYNIPNELMDQVHKLEDILHDLSSLKTDEVKTNVLYNKELLTKLAKLNPDVRVHIVSDLVNSSDPIIQSISDQLQEGGFYSIDSRISYIYPRSSEWKGTLPELINHELIHAATQEYIDTDKLTPEQLEHLEEIKEAIWSNNRESFDDIDSDVLDRINYAIFTSYPHEMFTVFGAESSSREILSQIGILDRFDTIFNNVLKEAANDNGQIKQRSSSRVNEEGASERVSGNAFRVPATIPAIRTATSSSENIERSPSNQSASLSSSEKNEVGQVDDKRKQNSNSDSEMPLHSRTKNQKIQGSNPKQVRTELVKRFGEDAINRLESNGVLSIVPTYGEQGVEGFAENGKVTLVADAITPDNIVPVFLHELGGHVGMQGTMKPAAYAVLVKEFNRLVKSGNSEALEAKRLAERETNADMQADEYLPYLITVAAQNQAKQGPVQKLVNRVFSAVKAWAVDKLGLDLKINSSDILALAERMIKTIANNPPPTGPKGRRYSKTSTDPQNMSRSKQREFLDKAASSAFVQMSLRGAESAKTLSNRTLNLFQTMLHKSLSDETGQFKKTFDLVQGKINHVTFASSKSMDVAPNVLIQLEQGNDYWKEVKRVGRTLGNTLSAGKINKAKVDTDLKKVGDLMFENTLMDNSERHSIKDLKQLGFDDDQIGLYNEVRDAIDTSLDTFANTTFSNIYKHLGGTNEEVLELAGQDLDILDHSNEILKRIDTLTKGKPEKAEARQAAIQAIDRVFKKANDLKDQGYVPLMRFGKYFVRIYNPTTGEAAYRQHFESESERNLFYRNYDQSKIPVGYEIEEGQINELQHKLFQGVSPETVALFAKESGLPIGDAETAYIKYAVQNNHALKRLLKRQGIDGFDNDLKRVLASFVMSNARYSANQTYNPAIDESITNIKDPAYQEDAIRLRDYSLDTQEELAAFKNFAFVYYMGFSAMFGVVNLTQPLLQTFPYLMQYSRDKGIIFRAFRKAVITWRKGTDAMDLKYRDHYERARKEGHLDPQNTWMMQGLERGKSGLGASTWQLISHASGLFAQASETVNRRTTLFAALDVAENLGQAKLEKLGFKDIYDFAIRTIQETQGIYNKGNRPQVARGNIGSVLMMYKQFMISYIEQMARMQKSGLYGGEDDEFKKKMAALVGFGVSRSVLAMLGILFFFSGATGLPFMRDILDGIETAGGLVGKPLNTEREIQIALHNALGQTLGSAATTVLMDGAFNLNPVVDVKGRMGMGDLIPATAYFSPTTSEYMKSAELANVAGPMGGLVEKVKEAVLLAQVGSYGQAGIQLLPKAITSTGQGAIAATTGDYRNMKTGVKTNSVEPWEGALKMMDMQPSSIAKEGRIRGLEMKDKAAQDYVNKRWKERYEEALATGDRTAVLDVKQQIKDYNKENERYPIKFNQKTAETNFKKSNQSWQEKRKNVKGLEWMSDYNPYLDQ